MFKKIIAIVPLWDDEKQSVWMLPNYLNAIRDSGGIPMILPLHVSAEDALQLFNCCDGLLMTGGHDISPILYGEEKRPVCAITCEARDTLEKALYHQAIEQDKAVLGICRGIQLINALEGGTLYQDLPTEFGTAVEHHGNPPYDQIIHEVNMEEHSPLYALLHTERLGVNSYHHQAIKILGADLKAMARADDGIIEAVCHTKKHFVWAVQWHPEFSFYADENSRKIFKAFVEAC